MTSNIEKKISQALANYAPQIKEWFISKFQQAPFYSSVDLRNSSFKLAAIDTNLFPAGFNNLNSISLNQAVREVEKIYTSKRVLIIIEDFTRNSLYTENILALGSILEGAGNIIRYGSFQSSYVVTSLSGRVLTIQLVKREGNNIYLEGYTPEVILLNNDMITGIPEILIGVNQQVLPNIYLGWSKRTKFHYFTIYNQMVKDFTKVFPIDSFYFSTLIDVCNNISFKEMRGIQSLAEKVEKMLDTLREQYKVYQIPLTPYIIVKANQGTFGMAVLSVKSGEELLHLNKAARHKMYTTKGGKVVDSVLLQEGIHTNQIIEGSCAELIANNIKEVPVAFIYRYHTSANPTGSLNKKGALFQDGSSFLSEEARYALNLVTKLAILAAQEEAKEVLLPTTAAVGYND